MAKKKRKPRSTRSTTPRSTRTTAPPQPPSSIEGELLPPGSPAPAAEVESSNSTALQLAQESPGLLTEARYEAIKAELATCITLAQVQQFKDTAEAYRTLAALAKDAQAMNLAAKLRICAEQRMGEFLENAPTNTGAKGVGKKPTGVRPPTLKELGLTKYTSATCRKLARAPKDEFEKALETKDRHGEITTAAVLRALRPTPPKPPTEEAKAREARQSMLWRIRDLGQMLYDHAQDGRAEAAQRACTELITICERLMHLAKEKAAELKEQHGADKTSTKAKVKAKTNGKAA